MLAKVKSGLTKRAPDVWDSAAFSSIFLASGFSCSQAESTPAHTQVTQTVRCFLMTQTNLYKYDAWQLIESMPDKSVDCIITDPLYDCELNLKELQRVCRGNIVVFCSPENQFFKPDEFAFWVKTQSTKNYSKHVGRFLEIRCLVVRPSGRPNDSGRRERSGANDRVEPYFRNAKLPNSLRKNTDLRR